MVCPKCKNENPDGAKFCEKCGEKLKAEKEVKEEGKEVKTAPSLPKIKGIPLKIILPLIAVIILVVGGVFGYQKLTNKPEMVVKKYLKAMGERDLTTALALVVPNDRLQMKTSLENSFSNVENLKIRNIKVKNIVISYDNASVDVNLDFEMKMKTGEEFSYNSSKDTMTIYDGKTRVEVPISEGNQYSRSQPFLQTVKLEKIKGKWYVSKEGW